MGRAVSPACGEHSQEVAIEKRSVIVLPSVPLVGKLVFQPTLLRCESIWGRAHLIVSHRASGRSRMALARVGPARVRSVVLMRSTACWMRALLVMLGVGLS